MAGKTWVAVGGSWSPGVCHQEANTALLSPFYPVQRPSTQGGTTPIPSEFSLFS